MSTITNKILNENNLFTKFEQQFRQLLLEYQSNKSTIKITQENLNSCSKHNIFLEHELNTERLNNSMLKMELDTLTTIMNKCYDKNNKSFLLDTNLLTHDREYLTNKIYETQIENLELKQKLKKLGNQICSLITNQNKYTEKTNLVTSLMNSLQVQINKLEKESHTLVNILCSSKILAKKILSALHYSENVNKTQFEHIQHLIKEVANMESKIDIFINQNEKQQKTDQNTKTLSNQTNMEICMKLVEILEIENNALIKSVHQLSDK